MNRFQKLCQHNQVMSRCTDCAGASSEAKEMQQSEPDVPSFESESKEKYAQEKYAQEKWPESKYGKVPKSKPPPYRPRTEPYCRTEYADDVLAAGGESAPKKLRLKIDTGADRVAVCVQADGTVADACAAAQASGYFKRPIRTLALADGRLEFNRTDMVSVIARLGEDLRPVYVED